MKKIISTVAIVLITTASFAQKARIQDAINYLGDKDYKSAIGAINEAVANDDTKGSAKAWFTRGKIYLAAATDSTSKIPNAVDEAAKSFLKEVAIDPAYTKDETNLYLFYCSQLAFNDGIDAYNAADYSKAYGRFMQSWDIFNLDNRKRFTDFPNAMALAATATNAYRYAGQSALYDSKFPEAITVFNNLRSLNMADTNTYLSLIDVYQRQKNMADMASIIAEARQKYPNNQNFRNIELNYYISTGNLSALLPKLEEAVTKDPNNGDLAFNLANVYNQIAFPKEGARPANYTEMSGKAEQAYLNAIKASNKPEYNYNLGVLYYNEAREFNDKMNDLLGSKSTLDPKDQKEYDAAKAQRNALFQKAVPFFESAYTTLDAKGMPNLNDEEANTLTATRTALSSIYNSLGQKDKADKYK